MGVEQQSCHGRTDDAETFREGGHPATTNNEAVPAGRMSSNFEIIISRKIKPPPPAHRHHCARYEWRGTNSDGCTGDITVG